MVMGDNDIAVIAAQLSAERLAALIGLTGSARHAIVLHQDTLKLGVSLMAITASIEIAVRNSVCAVLQHHFGTDDWLLEPPPPFFWKEIEAAAVVRALQSAQRAAYAKLSQAEKSALDATAFPGGNPTHFSHLMRTQARRRQLQVSDGKIIAELTLHFWKRLYGPDYDQTLWRTCLKRTFPDKSIRRGLVAEHMEVVYQSRNRIAHHEPVLHKRFEETMTSIRFIVGNLGVKTGDPRPLAKLLADDMDSVEKMAKALHARLASFRT